MGRASRALRGRQIGDIDLQAEFSKQLTTKAGALSDQGAKYLKQGTTAQATAAREARGAAAAASLVQNGFDPSNPEDSQKLIAAVAGGLCLIPGVGPVLGLAVETLYQVGNAIACPTEKFFASIGVSKLPPACGGAPCETSGNWTASGIIATNRSALPSMPRGSFAEFVVASLAQYQALAANCKASFPPGFVVDACVQIWNKVHQGPAVDYLVPPLVLLPGGIIPVWQNMSFSGSNPPPADRANKDPWAYYAFGPLQQIRDDAKRNPYVNANFSDVRKLFSKTPSYHYPSDAGFGGSPFQASDARIVKVNTGPLVQAPAPKPKTIQLRLGPAGGAPKPAAPAPAHVAPKPAGLSTPAKVVIGGGAALAVVALAKPVLFKSWLAAIGVRL